MEINLQILVITLLFTEFVRQNINLKNAQVYACGSNQMIESARELLIANSLGENQF